MYTIKKFYPNEIIEVLAVLDSGKKVVLESGSKVRWAVIGTDGKVSSTVVCGTKIYQVFDQRFVAQKEADHLNSKL